MKQFENFHATRLYCNNCGQSMPVKESLLLILPDGNLFDYRCAGCGESLGTRKETKGFSPDSHISKAGRMEEETEDEGPWA
jgi:hypothetical protein